MTATARPRWGNRDATLRRLTARNRLVAALRILVPAAGVLALVVLLGQIAVAQFARSLGVSALRIESGALVVEAPRYAGVGAGGVHYVATARSATRALGSPDAFDLIEANLQVTLADGDSYVVSSPTARLDVVAQIVSAPGRVILTGADGLGGTLDDVVADLAAEALVGRGPVDLVLPDGTKLAASGLTYDMRARVWRFERAEVTRRDLPEATP